MTVLPALLVSMGNIPLPAPKSAISVMAVQRKVLLELVVTNVVLVLFVLLIVLEGVKIVLLVPIPRLELIHAPIVVQANILGQLLVAAVLALWIRIPLTLAPPRVLLANLGPVL